MIRTGLPASTRWLGGLFVAAAVTFQALWLGWPASQLSLVLVIAYGMWCGSAWRVGPRLRPVFGLALLVFLAHVTEEHLMGVERALPELYGREPWSARRYLVFNGVWALVFAMAALGLRPGRALPALVVLFFAIAGGVGNGVVHLLLVLGRGGYVPGAWTAPLCLLVGVWLLRGLYGRGSSSGEAEGSPSRPR